MTSPAIESGAIRLDWIVRAGGRCRPFMAAFHLGDDPNGKVIRCNDAEVVSFSRFQRRALAVNAGFPEHEATKSTRGKREWSASVSEAIRAGQTVDLQNVTGFALIGGEW
jgi:hypothetical protein